MPKKLIRNGNKISVLNPNPPKIGFIKSIVKKGQKLWHLKLRKV